MGKPERMTTSQLLALIDSGAKREDLPTKTNGRSVVSTRESANSAYAKQLAKIEKTRQFKNQQKTLTSNKYFTAQKNTDARELVRQREALIKSGVKGTSLDLRYDSAVNVDTTKNLTPFERSIINIQEKPFFDFSDSSKYLVHGVTKPKGSTNPKNNEYTYNSVIDVNYDSDINNKQSLINEDFTTQEEIMKHVKGVGVGSAVAIGTGIVIYLMSKGKVL